MRGCAIFVIGLIILAAGCSALESTENGGAVSGARTIQAVRAETPPVIDGKLTDSCWTKVNPVTDFVNYYSDRPATYQSIARVCHDDTRLYIGVKCLMPKGVKPIGRETTHDTYIFQDDIVEIFVDPGRKQEDFYQMVVSASGSTFDCSRPKGGAVNKAWNGDWDSAAYIADGYWSMEMSIPLHNLGITPGVGSTWGLNICREARAPMDELSSIAERGQFTNVAAFPVLENVNADFSRHFFEIGPSESRFASDKKASFAVPVTNLSGKPKTVKIERFYAGSDGKDAVESKVVTLDHGEAAYLPVEQLDMAQIMPGRTDIYKLLSEPSTKKIVVSEAGNGTPLMDSVPQ